MNKLLDFIEHTYCVHDVNSPVRKEIEKDIEIFNPTYVFAQKPHSSVKINSFQYTGVFGATLSHLKLFTTAYIENRTGPILIFEDDVEIRRSVDIDNILNNSLPHLPEDWVTLYLNANPQDKVTNIEGNLYKCNFMWGVFAYIFNCKYLEEMLYFYIDQIGQEFPRCISDNIVKNFCVEYKKVPQYTLYPFIINHKEGIATSRNNGKRKYGEAWFQRRWNEHL